MTLLWFDGISLEFGDQYLLKNAQFSIEPGERVCLIGRNGTGKSSMFKLITEQYQPDQGVIQRKAHLCVSQLAQTLPTELEQSVQAYVTSGLADIRALRDQYEQLSQDEPSKKALQKLQELQQHIDAHSGWNIEQRVATLISELDLPAEKKLSELSGGWQRRVALAKALVNKPDLLLLDEPTNHLDLSTIGWLEDRVYAFPGAVLFITHDRAFLQRMATRIAELDRGQLTSWPGNYHNYLQLKEKALEDEATADSLFDKRLAEEETWIRQGIKARRTRNEGRVRALQGMRKERAQRVGKQDKARVHIEEAEQSGRKVIRAKNVSYAYGDHQIIQDLSLKVLRGDRIGIVGNNGVGKSTLLKLLLGELEPHTGTIKHGTNLEIGYFDQMRRELNPDKTVAENVGDGREYIKLNGKDRHIIGYLKGFLFSPKRAMTPVKALSGGECNRIILAKLFAQASNLLILDEPTNDLDVETLEVLEQRLVEFSGTLIVVSHDREFLDNVVTSVLVFEADGKVHEYVGGYQDWLKYKKSLAEVDGLHSPKNNQKQTLLAKSPSKPKKLSYKLQRELDLLPDQIQSLEQELKHLQEQSNGADFYSQPHAKVQTQLDQLAAKEQALETMLQRWSKLEELASGTSNA